MTLPTTNDSACIHVWSKTAPLSRVYRCAYCGATKVSLTGTRPKKETSHA